MTRIIRCQLAQGMQGIWKIALASAERAAILVDGRQCRTSDSLHTPPGSAFVGGDAMTRFDDGTTIKAEGQLILAPESIPWHLYPKRRAECKDLRKDADDLLGPHPEQTVEVFRDLGLNENEIAKYFGTSLHRIKCLSYGSERWDRFGSLREVAKLVRAKLFGGTF